jgi:hypothetical protein
VTRCAPCVARSECTTVFSSCWYTRSSTTIYFWFAHHRSGLSHPPLIDLVCSTMVSTLTSSTPSPSTTCIFPEQHGCCCVASSAHNTAIRVYAFPLHLHRRHLCIDDYAAQSLLRYPSTQGLRPTDWVFVIELPLSTSSLRPARRNIFSRIASSLSSTITRLGPSPLYAWCSQHRRVLSSSTRCWIWKI